MRRLRMRAALAALVVALTVGIAGCSTMPAGAGNTGTDYATLQFHPSWPADSFLSADYAAGLGEWWRPPGHNSIICGVSNGIALVSEPHLKTDSDDFFSDKRGTLRGIRMHDNAEIWRIENAACNSASVLEDHAYIALGDFTEGSTVERLNIASGDHVAKSEPLKYLTVDRAVIEIEATTLIFASFDSKVQGLVSMDDNVSWSNDWPSSWYGCHVLDGGPNATPEDMVLGCERGDGFALVDPRTGEFSLGPTEWRTKSEPIIWARRLSALGRGFVEDVNERDRWIRTRK